MNSKPAVRWPDWSGETAIVVATGPSAAERSLHDAKGTARFIAIKSSWQIVPWADVLYGSDRGWWVENNGVPEFKGLRVSASPFVASLYPEVKTVRLVKGASVLTDEAARIGCGSRLGGGHSGFHALNLAVQFGARRIVMVGFDMTQERGLTKEWCAELDGCAEQFKNMGVEVVNASAVSALTAYPKVKMEDLYGRRPHARRADRPRHRSDAERELLAEGASGSAC